MRLRIARRELTEHAAELAVSSRAGSHRAHHHARGSAAARRSLRGAAAGRRDDQPARRRRATRARCSTSRCRRARTSSRSRRELAGIRRRSWPATRRWRARCRTRRFRRRRKRAVVEELLSRSPVDTAAGAHAARCSPSAIGWRCCPDLADAFRARLMDHQQVVRAEVTTAVALPADRVVGAASRGWRRRPAGRCSSRRASIRRSSAARSRASAARSTTAASRRSWQKTETEAGRSGHGRGLTTRRHTLKNR